MSLYTRRWNSEPRERPSASQEGPSVMGLARFQLKPGIGRFKSTVMFEAEVFSVTPAHGKGRCHSALYQCIGPPEVKTTRCKLDEVPFPGLVSLMHGITACVKC